MELNITGKKENKLLKRNEISFEIEFDKAVPSRKEVRDALSTSTGANAELLVVKEIRGAFGTHKAKGVAHIYKDKDAMKAERKHLLVREGLMEKKKKEAAPKKAVKK